MAFNLTMKSKTAEATVSLTTDFLMQYLSLARNIVVKRTTIPILRYVRLVSKNGEGFLRVTDTDCFVEMSFTARGSGDIDVAVEHSAFLDLVSKAPKGLLLIEREGMKLTFKMNCTDCGHILGVSGMDCPSLITPPHIAEMTLSDFDARFVDKYVSPLCIEDKDYLGLRGILMEVTPDCKYGFISTDRNMLISTKILDPIERYILPTVAFKMVAEYGKESKIYVGSDCYRIVSGNLSVYGSYVDGVFPDYHRLVYTDYGHEHKVNVGMLRNELNRLLTVVEHTKTGICPVMLTYDNEYIGVKEVPDDYEFDKGGIKMDALRIVELLQRFDDNSTVAFKSFHELSKPTMWIDSRGTTLFMPLR